MSVVLEASSFDFWDWLIRRRPIAILSVRMPDTDYGFFTLAYSAERPTEIESWFKHSIIEPLAQMVEEQRHTQYVKISKQIVDMIENEYDSDLTLEICASRLHYHPSHISTIFHKEVGSTFKEYLAIHRLNASKKILTESDMTISEISKLLRYNNPQNFIRHFRKAEGTTACQYREANRVSGQVDTTEL